MAWIELHDNLKEHRKTYALSDKLKITNAHAVGLLCCLWTWALSVAEDGNLTAFPPRAIAAGAGWEKKPETFVNALIECGWLDKTADNLQIHDWDEYAGLLLERRERVKEQTRERVKRFKEKREDNALPDRYVTQEKREDNALPDRYVTQEKREGNALPDRYVTQEKREGNAPTVPNSTIPNSTVYISDNKEIYNPNDNSDIYNSDNKDIYNKNNISHPNVVVVNNNKNIYNSSNRDIPNSAAVVNKIGHTTTTTTDEKLAAVMQEINQYGYGTAFNLTQKDKLCSYLDDGMQPELIGIAFKMAAENSKPISWVWGTLNAWIKEGRLTTADHERLEAERRERSRASPKPKQQSRYDAARELMQEYERRENDDRQRSAGALEPY